MIKTFPIISLYLFLLKQNISEEASSGENQLVEMRAHNVIIENTSSTVDGKMKPQADGVEMVASTNVETDGGSVGQVD